MSQAYQLMSFSSEVRGENEQQFAVVSLSLFSPSPPPPPSLSSPLPL